jgi:AraC-like DNA-binding protein
MIVPDGNLADILLNAQIFLATKNRDRYEKVFTKIVKYSNLISENEKIILQSSVLELIYLISKEKTVNTYTGKLRNTATVIENSIKYINEHITEDLSLETLSSKMSLSPIYFHKIFKSSTGRKLRDYVEEQRIKKSIHLLQTTDYTLTRIAYECGFSSQSYFSYVFKRRMKDPPREYIKKLYDKYEI